MDLNDQKAELSVGYLIAVAAAAGYVCTSPRVDKESVDITISEQGSRGTIASPRLDVQLKCHGCDPPQKNADSISLRIKAKNFNDLSIDNLLVPRILVVLMVPKPVSEWILHAEEETRFRRTAYWLSLRGSPPVEGKTGESKVTVHLPRSNIFTVDALKGMMTRIGEGGLP
jgi:hypothetical protein